MENYEGSTSAALATENYDGVTSAVGGLVDTINEGLELPLPAPQKHQGSVASVRTGLSSNKGTPFIEINVHSDSNGADFKKTIYVIPQFYDNPNMNEKDPAFTSLPVPEGKKHSPAVRYANTIKNNSRTGELQQLLLATIEAGRTIGSFVTFEDLGDALNTASAGVPIVFTTKSERTDGGFVDTKVNNIYGANAVNFKGIPYWQSLKQEAADGSGQ